MPDRSFALPVELSAARVGWIGAGVMGASMAARLIAAGYSLTLFTRTKNKAAPLLAQGAAWADSPRAVAAASDIVITMVGLPSDVRDVYFSDDGILSAAREGHVLIDMTTSEPTLAVEIAAAARERGAYAIDAPVSGGDVGARNGTLSIMAGGEAAALDAVRPLLAHLGQFIGYQGPAGSGQHTKMCNQIAIAGTMIGVCESLLYSYRAGLDPVVMLDAIRRGAAACWTLDNLAPRMLRRDFAPGFMIEHFIKDMGIALDEARRLGLALPGLALVRGFYLAAQNAGHGRKGTHALLLILEELNRGVKVAES